MANLDKLVLPDGTKMNAFALSGSGGIIGGKLYINEAHTAWLIMNGNDCELHVPAGGAFVTVIEE